MFISNFRGALKLPRPYPPLLGSPHTVEVLRMVLGRRYCVVEQSRTSEDKMPCGLESFFHCSSVAFISLK